MSKKIIAITSGDIDGIGLEVTIKALKTLPPSKTKYIVFRNRQSQGLKLHLPLKKTIVVSSFLNSLDVVNDKANTRPFIEIESSDSPALWVQTAIQACLDNAIDGIVTGPVSKKTFIDSNLGVIGHTPLLKEMCRSKCVYMGFLGRSFNVVLLTGHIPIKEVEASLDGNAIIDGLKTIRSWCDCHLPKHKARKPLGIVGLNPHAGENGLIGQFEIKNLTPALKQMGLKGEVLVPDAAFHQDRWNEFSFYVCLYHDQGLIPFKMAHGHWGGAHVTLGIPIIRTSVDHGTALDIYGKGIARPESMIEAIQWCDRLIRKKEQT